MPPISAYEELDRRANVMAHEAGPDVGQAHGVEAVRTCVVSSLGRTRVLSRAHRHEDTLTELPLCRTMLGTKGRADYEMSPKIPGTGKPPWWERDFPTTLWSAALPLVATAVATLKAFAEDSSALLKSSLVAGTVLLAVGTTVRIVQSYRRDKAIEQKKSPIDLLGCILPVYESLLAVRHRDGHSDTGRLRITIHRIDHGAKMAEQCVDYVGETDSARKAGRTFNLSQGIIGYAARMKEPVIVERTAVKDEEYLASLMKEWSYTRQEAEALDRSRWSFVAFPILGDDGPTSTQSIGVLYADSTDPKFFTDEIQLLVLAATVGMAKFISMRYPS